MVALQVAQKEVESIPGSERKCNSIMVLLPALNQGDNGWLGMKHTWRDEMVEVRCLGRTNSA
jgi:hypothetical protein